MLRVTVVACVLFSGELDPEGAAIENELLQLVPLIQSIALEIESMMESQQKVVQ